MIWVAPSEKDHDSEALEKRLWAAADQLRANSGLTSQQYSQPVLGLIFLRFAEVRFSVRRSDLEKAASSSRRGSRVDEPSAYHAEGVLYLSPNARFDYLLALPEWEAVGKALSDAIRDIEKNNPSLASVLPKTYEIFNSTLLKELLKKGDCLLRHPTEQPRTTLNGKIMLWDLLWESRFWGPESPIVWIKCIGVTHLQ